MLCAACLLDGAYSTVFGLLLTCFACSVRSSLAQFVLELSCDSRIDRVIGICLLFSCSWLPASAPCTAAPAAILSFLFHSPPQGFPSDNRHYVIGAKSHALLCRSRLLLSNIMSAIIRRASLPTPSCIHRHYVRKDRVWVFIAQKAT